LALANGRSAKLTALQTNIFKENFMDANEKTEQRRVVVDSPSQRKEIVTETTQRGPKESSISTGMIAIVGIVAVASVGIILFLVSNRNAGDAANRNANIDIAAQSAPTQPATTIIQQPAPVQQAPIIIQGSAPAQQAPVIIQQPAQENSRDSSSDDANMQDIATKRLSEESDMAAVGISISGARAVLTGSVNSAASKAKAERLVKSIRGVLSVDNKLVIMS
jgi:osmotically-inducible protein OsmY